MYSRVRTGPDTSCLQRSCRGGVQLQMELVCVKALSQNDPHPHTPYPSTSLEVLDETKAEHLKNDPRKFIKD